MYENKDEYQICYMPDGSPAPEVLTEEETIRFLRLDENKNAASTLKYYRNKNLIRGTLIGKKLRYTKKELLNFLSQQTDRTNRHN